MLAAEERNTEKVREEAHLYLCSDCGCKGSGTCGRMIAKDESVWPNHDTGFRMTSNENRK